MVYCLVRFAAVHVYTNIVCVRAMLNIRNQDDVTSYFFKDRSHELVSVYTSRNRKKRTEKNRICNVALCVYGYGCTARCFKIEHHCDAMLYLYVSYVGPHRRTAEIPSFCLRRLFVFILHLVHSFFHSLFFVCVRKPDANNFHHRTILHHSSFLHALKVVSVNFQMAHVLAFAFALAPALSSYPCASIVTIKMKKIKNYEIFWQQNICSSQHKKVIFEHFAMKNDNLDIFPLISFQ